MSVRTEHSAAFKAKVALAALTSDKTYIPMEKGFLYLVVVMGGYSRKVLSWRLCNSMGTEFCVVAGEEGELVPLRPVRTSGTSSFFELHITEYLDLVQMQRADILIFD